MTRIDFYIIPDSGPGPELVACRLSEKILGLGHKVYLHVEDSDQAGRLDRLLWTFRDGSFVPHEIYSGTTVDPAPVVIGHHQDPVVEPEVLVNLTHEIPEFFSRFERVAELVGPDQEARALSRERFRFYRERGYPLHTHQL